MSQLAFSGAPRPSNLTFKVSDLDNKLPAIDKLFDGIQLRHALSALAQESPDQARLRTDALSIIKNAFQGGRTHIREQVEGGRLGGQVAARALSSLQDATIQVIYDFATKHFDYA